MGNFIKSKKIIFCLAVIGILATNSAVFAALQVDWPNSPMRTPLEDDSELPVLIKYLYEWGVALGGLAVFVVLIIAGFQYLTSTGDSMKMKEAMGRIRSAVLGLVLLLASVLILNTINPALTTFRPLVMLPPGEMLGGCEGEDDEYCENKFGKGYICKDNFCVLDLEELSKIKNCGKVTVKADAGQPIEIGNEGGDGMDEPISINPRGDFWVKAEPERCLGTLILTTKSNWWGGCGGDKRSIPIQPGTVSYTDEPKLISGELDVAINCARLENLESGF